MKLRLVCLSLITLTIIGCGSTPKVVIQPFEKNTTTDKSFDKTWSSLVRFFSSNDISISTIEKDSGIIQLEGERLTASLIQKYCDGRASFLNAVDSGTARGSVLVSEEDGFVTTDVNIRFSFTTVYLGSNPPQYTTRNCQSTGVFETAVLNSVK